MDNFFQNLTTDFLVEITPTPIDNVGGGKKAEKPIGRVKAETSLLSADNLGFTAEEDYTRLLSPALRKDAHANLNEKEETRRYIAEQPFHFLQELDDFNEKIARPMARECRVAITIPAFQEEGNIYKTLSQFTQQMNRDGTPLDPNAFEIVVVDNHKESISEDKTEVEVAKFITEYPHINVSYAHKKWRSFEPACVGNARKYAADLAIYRSVQRPQQDGDLLLVSFDADIDGVNPTYVANYINQFDTNKQLDAAAGKWTLPDEIKQKPTLHAAQRFRYILDRLLQTDALSHSRDKHPPMLFGANSAIRADIYAAIGGYNPYAKLAEDLEIGWMIDHARHYDSARFKYINSAQIVTNPRRFLSSFLRGIPIINMYDDYHENEEIRTLNNTDMLAKIPNTLDPQRLQREIDAVFQHYFPINQGPDAQAKMHKYFKAAMYILGADYMLESQRDSEGVLHPHIKITNISKLGENLRNPTFDTNDANNLLKIKYDLQTLEDKRKMREITTQLQVA